MPDKIDLSVLERAVKDVKNHWPNVKPELSLVLGSGWGDVVKAFKIVDELSYQKITGLGKGGVIGHASKLTWAKVADQDIFIFQGRRHWYEGQGWSPVVLPAYITKRCGASIFFLTNAAGGISFGPGSLMIIKDHINFMFAHPLIGPHLEELGTRFPDQSCIYSPELRMKIKQVAAEVGIKIDEGIYLAESGPSYETPAEIRFFKIIGADSVGMSTVPEIILGNALGLKIAAISCVSNYAAGLAPNPLSHKEVVEELNKLMPTLAKLIPNVVQKFLET